MRTLARSPSCGAVFGVCLVTVFANADARNTRLLKSAVNRSAGVGTLKKRAKQLRDIAAIDSSVTFNNVPQNLSRLSRLAHSLLV